MPTDIVIPSLGESISEGVIASWLKEDGEYVQRDEPVLELETDKITTEIPAPAAGAIHRAVDEGQTVKVGATVGSIDESAEKPESVKSQKQQKKTEQAERKESQQAKPTAKESKASKQQAEKAAATSAESQRASSSRQQPSPSHSPSSQAATPLARKIAEDYGVDLSDVSGTGAGGRIREQDVLAFIQSHPNGAASGTSAPPSGAGVSPANRQPSTGQAPAAPSPISRQTTRERMSPLRQRVASRLVEAQHTAAMLTTFNECDMTQVINLRKRYKEAFQEKHGVGLGFMSFFVKAAVSALQTFPRVNSQISQNQQGEPEIVAHHYCDIAVAVGTPKGLVVPVVRNCESLSFARIESSIRDLAEKAHDGKLSLEQMQGGTFTISNGGIYGSMMSTPILNPLQSAILGMHNIVRRPVEDPAKPGSGEVIVRPMMYLALSYDHRLIDGAEAVGFLKHIKECVEAPERLTIGV